MASKIELYPQQLEAVNKLKSGSILNGGVGSGKTLTALYFYKKNYSHLKLRVISTAKHRDEKTFETEGEIIDVLGMNIFEPDYMIVDSWNNIHKYEKEENCFFIFDEQRAIGAGPWSKSFIKIAKKNKWIMLSATPGDVWMDYIPVFIANGFYRNRTHFNDEHIRYDPYCSFPKVKEYLKTDKLIQLRKNLLVNIPMHRHTHRIRHKILCEYDKDLYLKVIKERWNVFKNEPIRNSSELTQLLRRIVATDKTRQDTFSIILGKTKRVIVFYNYNYELEIIKDICTKQKRKFWEYNGSKHDKLPTADTWVYIVHYSSREGWNCITTDTIIFYSPNYSYSYMEQAEGRIDRMNTEYSILNYYMLYSKSPIDSAVFKAINTKKKFNESAYGRSIYDGETGELL